MFAGLLLRMYFCLLTCSYSSMYLGTYVCECVGMYVYTMYTHRYIGTRTCTLPVLSPSTPNISSSMHECACACRTCPCEGCIVQSAAGVDVASHSATAVVCPVAAVVLVLL